MKLFKEFPQIGHFAQNFLISRFFFNFLYIEEFNDELIWKISSAKLKAHTFVWIVVNVNQIYMVLVVVNSNHIMFWWSSIWIIKFLVVVNPYVIIFGSH